MGCPDVSRILLARGLLAELDAAADYDLDMDTVPWGVMRLCPDLRVELEHAADTCPDAVIPILREMIAAFEEDR